MLSQPRFSALARVDPEQITGYPAQVVALHLRVEHDYPAQMPGYPARVVALHLLDHAWPTRIIRPVGLSPTRGWCASNRHWMAGSERGIEV